MAEHDDRRAAAQVRHVLGQPLELLVAERAHPFALVLEHVHQADEVGAFVVEALPASAADGALTVPPQVFLAAVEKDVVLAGHVERALRLHALEQLGHRVEGPRFLTMGLIAGVQHEGRARGQRVHAVDDLLERGRGVRVGLALEPDVRVADLHEAEGAGLALGRVSARGQA